MLGKSLLSMSALSLYRNAVQFALNLVMARFIAPADYGLLAFTAPFIAFLGLMTDLGLSSAIVRSGELTPRQVAAAFTLTLAIGLALGAGLAALAFPVQHLVGMRGLGPVMAAMAGVVVLNVAASTPRALLERELRYGRIATIEAGAVLLSAVAAVALVLSGAGIWSLVAYNILTQTLRAVAFMTLTRSALRIDFGWAGLRPLLSFGGWVLATNGLTFFARNSDNLLIGGVLGAAAVGLYGLSYQFMLIPLMAITWPASAVMFAMLSRQALHPARVRETVRGVMCATAALSFPAMVYLTFGLAWPAHVLLSPRWAGVPAIVSWLAPVGALQSISSYSGAVLMADGKARLQFLLNLAGTVATVAVFVATVRLGLGVLVESYAVAGSLVSLALVAATIAATALTWTDVARALTPGATATAAGGLAAALAGRFAAPGLEAWAACTGAYAAGVLATYVVMSGALLRALSTLRGGPAAEPAA